MILKFSRSFTTFLVVIFGLIAGIEFVSGCINLVIYLNSPTLNLISATSHTFTLFPLMQTNGLTIAKSDIILGFLFLLFGNGIYFYPEYLSSFLLIFSITFAEYSFLSWAYFIGCIAPGWECHNLLSFKYISVFQIRMLTLPFLPLSQDLFALLLITIVFVMAYNHFESFSIAGMITSLVVMGQSLLIYYFDYPEFYLHFESSISQLYFISNFDILVICIGSTAIFANYILFLKIGKRKN